MSGLPICDWRLPIGASSRRFWRSVVPALVLLSVVAPATKAEHPAVPRALGKGTGGDGAWSCSSAAHSPTTVKVQETAGPEGAPAAVLEFEFTSGKYNWNWAIVSLGSVQPSRFKAVQVTYRSDVAPGFAKMNLMVCEAGGAGYWVPEGIPLSPKRFRTVTVSFDKFALTPWSKDENGRLDVNLIRDVSIGFETGSSGKARLLISDVELVPEGW